MGEMREHLDASDPHHRLWLPGRKWMAQRTLSRTVAALLPTPSTNDNTTFPHDRDQSMDNLATRIQRIEGQQEPDDLLLPTPTAWLGRRPENATADPERMASREHEGTRGKRSLELPEALAQAGITDQLLPTPTAKDAAGSRNATAIRREDAGAHHSGATLTDAVYITQGAPEDIPVKEGAAEVRLLPTPQAIDGDGGRQEKGAMGRGGVRPSGHKATLPLPTAVAMRDEISDRPFASATVEQASLFDMDADAAGVMLPTPVANPENPGAGGELRAAIVHGEGRRNETGIDTMGRPNQGRPPADDPPLLPTPAARDAKGPYMENRQGGPDLARALPTPTASDADRTSEQYSRHYTEGADNPTLLGAARQVEWGVYEGAVRRWEEVSGREAPAPTDAKGRLDPPFVEWMLGYPEGWFDVEGMKHTSKLRALGNSVQVQCGEAVGGWIAGLIDSGLLLGAE